MEELFKEIAGTLVYGIWIIGGFMLQFFVKWLTKVFGGKSTLEKKVDTIVGQVTTNGGSAIPDQIAKLIRGQEADADNIERLIRGQEAQFSVMLSLSSEPLFRADKNGLWTSCNHKLTEIFGMYQRDMLAKGWEIAIGKNTKERDEFVKAWNEFFKDQRPLNHQVNIVNQETNTSQLYLFTARQIIEDGEFQFFLGKVTKVNV